MVQYLLYVKEIDNGVLPAIAPLLGFSDSLSEVII